EERACRVGWANSDWRARVSKDGAARGRLMLPDGSQRECARGGDWMRPAAMLLQLKPTKPFACGPAATLRAVKLRPVLAIHAEHSVRVVGRRELVAELLDQAPRLAHLLGVAFCELAATDEQAVFETHAHVAAHHHRLGGERHLETPGAEHRPRIVVAEQLVG